jgi:REP element-mobilizing transposase RayT
MPEQPLPFFITFTTYGAWLHGKELGSVDPQHNEFGTPFLPADAQTETDERNVMSQASYLLDGPRRTIVLATIREVCRHRKWRLLACHVRTTHVHLIVQADAAPEKIMNDCKAYASRRLNEAGLDEPDRKRWTRHGSTKYVWDNAYLGNAIDYVWNRQGEPMERFIDEEMAPMSEPRP